MKTIYLIQQSSGSYEDYFVNTLGFCETEEEAKRVCNEMNSKMPHNPFTPEQEDQFMDLQDVWAYIEQSIWEGADSQNPYGQDKETADLAKYNDWIKEHKIEETIEIEKMKFFGSKEPIIKDRSWSEVIKEYEAWNEYQIWEKDEVRYTKIEHI